MEEVREQFLRHVNSMVNYWENETRATTSQEKLEGLAFSIMSALDGCVMTLPAFIVAPMPDITDKEYAIEQGDDYYPYNDEESIKCDIGGSLHELLSQYK
jgi:hypothetical protein